MDATIYSEALVPVYQHGATSQKTNINIHCCENLKPQIKWIPFVSFLSGKIMLSILNPWRLERDPNSYFVLIIFLSGKINIIYKFIFIFSFNTMIISSSAESRVERKWQLTTSKIVLILYNSCIWQASSKARNKQVKCNRKLTSKSLC
jgi:hypothetical protein